MYTCSYAPAFTDRPSKLYCSQTEARIGVNSLPKVATQQRGGRVSNPQPLSH